MEKVKVLQDIELRRSLIARIRRDYQNAEGGYDWNAAFAEHPEWKSLLGWNNKDAKQRAYAMGNWVKEAVAQGRPIAVWSDTGHPAAPAPAPTPLPAASRPKGAWSGKFTPEQQVVIDQIVAGYQRGKNIYFKEAFTEHPEWASVLQATSRHDLQSLSYRVRQHLGRLIRQKQAAKAAKVPAPSAVPKSAPAVPAHTPRVTHYCQGCGSATVEIQPGVTIFLDASKVDVRAFNLPMLETSLGIAIKHSGL